MRREDSREDPKIPLSQPLTRIVAFAAIIASPCNWGCGTGPKGDPGDPGPKGDPGNKGDPGPKGDPGSGQASCIVEPGESIQACIDKVLAQGGGTVFLRKGLHMLRASADSAKNPVHVHGNNVLLQGEGPSTVLRLDDAVNAPPILIGGNPSRVNPDENEDGQPPETPVHHVGIRDLVVDANRAKQSGEAWPAHPHINISGIVVRQAEDVRITDVTVTSASSAGILCEKSTRRLVLDRVELRDSAFDGFSCNKSYDSQIVNSRFTHNVFAGITATCDCSDNIFEGNLIAGNGVDPMNSGHRAPGIFFADAHRNLISNNIIDNNTDSAILIKGPDCGPNSNGASLNYFTFNRVTRNTISCGVFIVLDPPPGNGNVAFGTFYQGNAQNKVCPDPIDPNLFEDRSPVVIGIP